MRGLRGNRIYPYGPPYWHPYRLASGHIECHTPVCRPRLRACDIRDTEPILVQSDTALAEGEWQFRR